MWKKISALETRESMFKAHPVPSIPVMKAPKVDEFVLSHSRARFPRSNEAQLQTIQTVLHAISSRSTDLSVGRLDCE